MGEGPDTKRKVAILGGGGGGVAAAMALTATPELRSRYEVTIHTPGWRLGGKAASGRDLAADARIEEHGIHVMFGFYANAFQMIQEAYAEAGRAPGAPLATWEEAFTPLDDLVVYEQADDGSTTGFAFRAPVFPGTPGQGGRLLLGEAAQVLLRHAASAARELLSEGVRRGHHTQPGHHGWLRRDVDRIAGRIEGLVADSVDRTAHHLLDELLRHLERGIGALLQHELEPIIRSLRTLRDVFYDVWVADHLDEPTVRFWFTTVDLTATVLAGIVADDLVGHGFQTVNGEELRAWLRRHRAEPVTVDTNPLLRALYDLTFAYEQGDVERPNVAAGQALEAMIRIVTGYHGHIVYKMNAGMGDTIFGPCYEVLLRRGVRFEFFRWIDRLHVDATHDVVSAIDLFQQTTPAADYPYLVDVAGLPSWPNQPDWSALERGDELRGVDLEHTPNPLGNEVTTLRRGVDFDDVVLAISLGGLQGSDVCTELTARNPRIAAMLEHGRTVATQAIQAWTTQDLGHLGWQHPGDSIAGAYVEPINTYCDMSQLLARESRPAGAVGSVGYLCGPMQDVAGDAEAARADVRGRAVDWFEHRSQGIWPGASPGGTFDWDVLVDAAGRRGADRIDGQYLRANTEGTERYVLTTAGSVQYRLWPDETGFDNLVFAGDWTRNGIDGGSFEAAVASGRLASQALSGSPAEVPGTTGILVDSRERREASAPQYVDFGGLDTFPGPYDCRNTTLFGFAVTADAAKLQSLIDRVLNQPQLSTGTPHPRRYAALGPFVMLSLGDIANVVPRTPPYSGYGSVDERQVAVWVPCVEVGVRDGRQRAERFWMFTAYIWVDNSLSMATGREVYGWPKSLGRIRLPAGADPAFHLETYGIRVLGPGSQPEFLPLLTVRPAGEAGTADGARPAAEVVGESLGELVADIRTVLEDAHDDHLANTWGIDADLLDDLATEAIPEIYLKQIRDIANGTDAAYQAICGSRAKVERIRWKRMMLDYALELHAVASHPLAQDLGIVPQTLLPGYAIEMDFLQDVGEVMWEAPRPR